MERLLDSQRAYQELLKSALDKKQESAAHTEAVAEMGSSLEAEIVPQVIELEDRTVTLSGTVQAQYAQWRELLEDIYRAEVGDLAPPPGTSDTTNTL